MEHPDIEVTRENIALKTGSCSLARCHVLYIKPHTAAVAGLLGPGSVLLPVVPAGPSCIASFYAMTDLIISVLFYSFHFDVVFIGY